MLPHPPDDRRNRRLHRFSDRCCGAILVLSWVGTLVLILWHLVTR
jgi:hypothetical protein